MLPMTVAVTIPDRRVDDTVLYALRSNTMNPINIETIAFHYLRQQLVNFELHPLDYGVPDDNHGVCTRLE